MMLGRFSRVVIRMLVMPMRYVRVMGSLLMISTFVMLGRLMMVSRRMLVMLSGFLMVICAFVGHLSFLSKIWIRRNLDHSGSPSILPSRFASGYFE
jgi:hypothetical protein